MKRVPGIFVLLFIIFSVSSCDLFLSSPRMRENPWDNRRQLTAFTAVPASTNSVITMWNWRPVQDWIDPDERIEKINIVHSTLGYPDLLNIPFVGETFSDSAKWQFTWKDLAPDTTHYFSLFMRDENGRWHPPLHAKAKLPGVSEIGLTYNLLQTANIDSIGGVILNVDPLSITNSQWAVLSFDLPDNVFITNASINVSITFNPTLTEITFVALDGLLPDGNQEKWDRLQDSSIVNVASAVTFNIAQTSYDITEVVRAAVIGREKAILIKTTDGSSFTISNNLPAPFITADIIK